MQSTIIEIENLEKGDFEIDSIQKTGQFIEVKIPSGIMLFFR